MSDRAQVRNTADASQVRRAERRDARLERTRLGWVRWALSHYEGRALLWSELERHHIFESITVQSSMIYAMSGRRDAGLELLAECQHWPDLYLAMQGEAIQRAEADNRETDAAHTPSAQPRSE